MRFAQGLLAIYDWDHTTWTATFEVADDHTFTVNDGGQNFGDTQNPTDTFSFRIQGATLTIALAGQNDAWAGTSLEEAPWSRVS